MKKKIEFANLTSSLASWLLEKLKAAPLDVGNIDEFKEGIEGLLDGSNNSLMLEIDDDITYEEHCFDIIEIGNLTIRPKERRVLYNNKEVSLTPKEYDILLFLVTVQVVVIISNNFSAALPLLDSCIKRSVPEITTIVTIITTVKQLKSSGLLPNSEK